MCLATCSPPIKHITKCGADPVVIEVVAPQVRNRSDHPDLHDCDAGDVGGYRHRQRGHATDVGHEALRRGETYMVVDDRGDRFINRAALPLQMARGHGLRAGHSSVAVDGDLEYLAQRAAGSLRGHEIGHRGHHRGDPAAHVLR